MKIYIRKSNEIDIIFYRHNKTIYNTKIQSCIVSENKRIITSMKNYSISTITLSSLIWYPTQRPSFSALSSATRWATAMAEILRGWVQMMLRAKVLASDRASSRRNWGTWVVLPQLQHKLDFFRIQFQCKRCGFSVYIRKTCKEKLKLYIMFLQICGRQIWRIKKKKIVVENHRYLVIKYN